MSALSVQARSVYRRILRELPVRTPSMLANPSPLQKRIRADFTDQPEAISPPSLQHQIQNKSLERRLEEAEQYIQYLAAQRIYITLLERYNPGMNMTEEERVRLTARRVGLDLPEDGVGSFGRGRA